MNLTKYCGVWFFNVYNLIKGSTLHLPICITVLITIYSPSYLTGTCVWCTAGVGTVVETGSERGHVTQDTTTHVLWSSPDISLSLVPEIYKNQVKQLKIVKLKFLNGEKSQLVRNSVTVLRSTHLQWIQVNRKVVLFQFCLKMYCLLMRLFKLCL